MGTEEGARHKRSRASERQREAEPCIIMREGKAPRATTTSNSLMLLFHLTCFRLMLSTTPPLRAHQEPFPYVPPATSQPWPSVNWPYAPSLPSQLGPKKGCHSSTLGMRPHPPQRLLGPKPFQADACNDLSCACITTTSTQESSATFRHRILPSRVYGSSFTHEEVLGAFGPGGQQVVQLHHRQPGVAERLGRLALDLPPAKRETRGMSSISPSMLMHHVSCALHLPPARKHMGSQRHLCMS